DGIHVRVATAEGPATDVIARDAAVSVGFAALRRDAVLEVAFATIGAPYGWGGRGGGRDCSQLLRDVLVPFGVALPRHSSLQALAGTRTIEVDAMTSEQKLAAIAAAAQDGLVLLYMPGHIMLDLGEREGRRWAISAISEYLEPCPTGGDTLRRLDRVAVTDLELGRDSARGAFIERITRLAVIGDG
ncbi:MAG: C40 family peptidase, partial [Deltaproteobacteria bacterium]|nr:C40 family peptidase [Nannocystaceae bacterium]